MAAMSMGFPAGSRRTPLQEGGGEEWREGIRMDMMTRKKARASGRGQESIERHYTRVDFEDDGREGGHEILWRLMGVEMVCEIYVRRATQNSVGIEWASFRA
jgi:hypothetical protein